MVADWTKKEIIHTCDLQYLLREIPMTGEHSFSRSPTLLPFSSSHLGGEGGENRRERGEGQKRGEGRKQVEGREEEGDKERGKGRGRGRTGESRGRAEGEGGRGEGGEEGENERGRGREGSKEGREGSLLTF